MASSLQMSLKISLNSQQAARLAAASKKKERRSLKDSKTGETDEMQNELTA
jgi:hypothetical protein